MSQPDDGFIDGTFIYSVEEPSKGKTKVFWLGCSKGDAMPVGRISWYWPWRKYCFFPSQETVFEQAGLREIADFCDNLTKEHVARRKADQ